MSLSSPGTAILFEHSEWFQPLFAELDRRGIAYHYLLAGDTAQARRYCQDFLALWKDADPDVPVLQQARAEYAQLQ